VGGIVIICTLCCIIGLYESSSPEYQARLEREEREREESKYKLTLPGTPARKIEEAMLDSSTMEHRHDNIKSLRLSDGKLTIEFEFGALFNVTDELLYDASAYFEFIYSDSEFIWIHNVVLIAWAETEDRYGNMKMSRVAKMSLPANIGKKLNYNNLSTEEFGLILLTEGTYETYVTFK
jgi:hypothetical protein